MRIHIKNARVIDPANGKDGPGELFIADGKISREMSKPERVIDAKGLVLAPGFIDLAARLREPGYEYKATLESEMDAAVAGGVTSLACPPDTDPPLDEPGLVDMLRRRAKALERARVYPIGALTVKLAGEGLTEMGQLTDAGCVAFSQANAPLPDTQVLWRALQYAATFGYPVWLRAEDAWLAKGGVAHDGEIATRLGLAGIPALAETIALATILALVRDTGVRVHICRLSSAESVALVRAAKRDGLPVTCDVAIHHLHLCDVDIGWFDSNARLVPPLRTTRDRAGLRAGVADGTIDVVCSDHAPVDDDGKQVPFGEAEPGATGLELLLPLTLKWASEEGVPLATALAKLTSAPARVMGIAAGTLDVGAPADVCVFDPGAWWKVERAALRSQGKNTPFLGHEVPGQVRCTIVSGHVVHESSH